MKLRYWVILTMGIVTPISMWVFGFSLGIMIGVASPIFLIPAVVVVSLIWEGRNGRNVWK